MKSEHLEIFFNLADEILLSLRELKMPTITMQNEILQCSRELKKEFLEKNTLPKELGEVFLDMPTAIYACIERFEPEDVRLLFNFLNKLQSSLRDICVLK